MDEAVRIPAQQYLRAARESGFAGVEMRKNTLELDPEHRDCLSPASWIVTLCPMTQI